MKMIITLILILLVHLFQASSFNLKPEICADNIRLQRRALSLHSTKSRYANATPKPLHRNSNKQRAKSPSIRNSRPNLPNISEQLSYSRNGHAAIRNSLDANVLKKLRTEIVKYCKKRELLAWQQKVEVAADSPSLAASCTSIEACQKELRRLGIPYSLPFLQYFHTNRDLPDVRKIAVLLAESAAVLLDVPAVRLYQDALFWKRPGDGPTPWHVDARMAPFDTSHLITFWIPLQAVPADGTALVFCSKSHSDFALPYWNSYKESAENPDSPWNRLEERYERDYSGMDSLVDYMPLDLGDMTAHSGWTLHCANANTGKHDRLALAITYVDARAPVRVRTDEGDSEDVWSYQDWISQVPRGTPDWDHPLVPIIWSK
jgi:hypothetical protein